VPSANDLRELLWAIAFPNDPIDEISSLADVFDVAVTRAGNRVGELLKEVFAIDCNRLPKSYATWFSMPWARVYTLNIDDLDDAVQHAFELPRQIQSVSALTDGLPTDATGNLLSIHLNGRANDYPQVTFSQRQYGERTARPDPWYQHLVTDLAGHPVLFIGTVLDEALSGSKLNYVEIETAELERCAPAHIWLRRAYQEHAVPCSRISMFS
jgi:hypothetical protein